MNYFAFFAACLAFSGAGGVIALAAADAIGVHANLRITLRGRRAAFVAGLILGLVAFHVITHFSVMCDLRSLDAARQCRVLWQ